MVVMMMNELFSSKDLSLISRRTSANFHSENRLFVAKKVGALKQAKIIEETVKSRNKKGFLDSVDSAKQQKAWDEVVIIGRKKLGDDDWDKVYSKM